MNTSIAAGGDPDTVEQKWDDPAGKWVDLQSSPQRLIDWSDRLSEELSAWLRAMEHGSVGEPRTKGFFD